MIFDYIAALFDWCKVVLSIKARPDKNMKFYREGEIWWSTVGMNIGVEISGKGENFTRPVLVFKKLSKDAFLGMPLTSQRKVGTWYIPFSYNGKSQAAILSQVKIMDAGRLTKRIGMLSDDELVKIKNAFHGFYCPENSHPASPEEAEIGG